MNIILIFLGVTFLGVIFFRRKYSLFLGGIMKLYYASGACSLSVRILIHELGLTIGYESVDLQTKKTALGEDFLKINPKGSVPVLQLDSGEFLTENLAIHCYLAEVHQATRLFPPIGSIDRYHVLEWMSFLASDVHKGFGVLFTPSVPEDLKNKVFKPNSRKKLDYINQRLGKNIYLMGDQYTLPDAYLYAMLRWLAHFDMKVAEWPHIARYYDSLKNRASIQMSLKEENQEI